MKSSPRPMAAQPRAFKAKPRLENFDDLIDDRLQDVYFTETALLKAMPKPGNKIKKMKSR